MNPPYQAPPPPPRYVNHALAERLNTLVAVAYHDSMQDWPLEVADPALLREFCDAYEDESILFDRDERFALMKLILYSLDESEELQDWLEDKGTRGVAAAEPHPVTLPDRVIALLRRDFLLHLHTINYWRLPEETNPEYLFVITPLLRQVWDECYRPEFDRWLDDDEDRSTEQDEVHPRKCERGEP
jgi:hypothetical protein